MRLSKSLLIVFLLWVLPIATVQAAERMAVKFESANVRSGPSMEAKQLWQIERYHPVLVLEIKSNWCRFKDFEGDEGWVHLTMLDKTPTVIVRANHCNVRTGPGTQYDVAFTVDKGIPFKVLQKKGDWVEVQHADGDHGWLSKTLVW